MMYAYLYFEIPEVLQTEPNHQRRVVVSRIIKSKAFGPQKSVSALLHDSHPQAQLPAGSPRRDPLLCGMELSYCWHSRDTVAT